MNGQPDPYLHRDIKLENMCYNEEHGYFVLIDYGAFCRTDGSNWFSLIDPRWVQPVTAA